jgi:hypothetical protein
MDAIFTSLLLLVIHVIVWGIFSPEIILGSTLKRVLHPQFKGYLSSNPTLRQAAVFQVVFKQGSLLKILGLPQRT